MKLTDFIEKITTKTEVIWEFAKSHTALFLGLATAAVSVVTLMLNIFEYCYNLGYYHYGYNIPISLFRANHTTGMSGEIFLCIALTCILTIYTFLGRAAYRIHRYFCLVAYTFLFLVGVVLSLIFIQFWVPSWIIVISALIVAIIIAFLLTLVLNIFTISYCIFPTNEDRLQRMKVGCEKLKDKLDEQKLSKKTVRRLEKKYEVLQIKIEEIEEKEIQKEKEQEKKFNEKTKVNEAIAIVAAMVISLLVVLIILFGFIYAEVDRSYTTVINKSDVCNEIEEYVPETVVINSLVVLYQTNEVVVVSPCYISEGMIKIYSEYQRTLSMENLIFHYDIYQEVETES